MDKFQALLESYGMLTKQQRLFYPRNFKLSTEFIAALKREIAVQTKAGLDPDEFTRKLNKALQFYVADFKKVAKAKLVKDEPVAQPLIAAKKVEPASLKR